MVNKKYFLLILTLLSLNTIYSQTNIKTMFYNLLNYPTAPPNNRDIILNEILLSYQPDLFFVCELESTQAANSILSVSLDGIEKNYEKAQFFLNQSDTSPDSSLQQLVFYNSDFFILDSQEVIITNVRDINRYTFILKTPDYETNPIYLETFVTHLKSSQGTVNQQLRLEMVEKFTEALDKIDANRYVIFAGDFNFYTSSESGYQKILDNNNNIIMKDILNLNNILQSWHNNSSWKEIHTQSTRLSNSGFNGFGAGGGLDDRFDFIMVSENILSNNDLNYVSDSYINYGNNNNCFNDRIDSTSCSGEFNQELRDNLYQMSDHLPVVLELETQVTLSLSNNNVNNLIKLVNGNVIDEYLTIKIEAELLNKDLIIYNALGELLIKTKINDTEMNLNLSGFSKGVYYLNIKNTDALLKFIKI
jgi:chaperonin cofactor prefoldin